MRCKHRLKTFASIFYGDGASSEMCLFTQDNLHDNYVSELKVALTDEESRRLWKTEELWFLS